MTDPDKIVEAITEVSKASGALIEAGRDAGAYLSDILGDLPKNLVSLFIGDRVASARAINLARLQKRAEEKVAQLGVSDKKPIEDVPRNLLIEISAAAADETREELFELWANLLASALDPNTSVRRSFVDALKQMDPPDAIVFRGITMLRQQPHVNASGTVIGQDRVAALIEQTKLDRLDVLTSITRLSSIGVTVTDRGTYNPRLTDFGQSLARAVLR